MDTNKMREQFETALVTKLVRELAEKAPGLPADAAEIIVRSQWLERKGDGYAAPVPDHGWWAWQASREAVVVELPEKSGEGKGHCSTEPFEHYGDGWDECLENAVALIEAQGLRVTQ